MARVNPSAGDPAKSEVEVPLHEDAPPTEVVQGPSANIPESSQFPEPATAKPEPGDNAPRYRVQGLQPVFGLQPGEIARIPADVTAEQLRSLIGAGFLALESDGPAPDQNKE